MEWIETKMSTTLSCCGSCEDESAKPMKTTKPIETPNGYPTLKMICDNLSKYPNGWVWKLKKLCN